MFLSVSLIVPKVTSVTWSIGTSLDTLSIGWFSTFVRFFTGIAIQFHVIAIVATYALKERCTLQGLRFVKKQENPVPRKGSNKRFGFTMPSQ
jgi:hypothetical protein